MKNSKDLLHSASTNCVTAYPLTVPLCINKEETGIVQAVQRPATGWTVRGSNLGSSEISRTHPDRHWNLPSLVYDGYLVSFMGVKRPGRDVVHPPTHPPTSGLRPLDCWRFRVRIPPGAWVSFLCEFLCVVRWRSLRRADHPSKGVLPNLMCLSVIVKPQ
jgi:hypothetical protein